MTSCPSLIINLAVSARVTALWNMPELHLICVTWIDLSRSLKVKDNGAIWNLIYDFLSIINSNSVVILNRFVAIGHWKPVWPGLIFQGHSRSKTMFPNETSYMTSVTYEDVLGVRSHVWGYTQCQPRYFCPTHVSSSDQLRRRDACPAYHTPVGAFYLRTTLAASTSGRARIRLIKMHNFAVLGPAIGQFPYTN